MHPDDEAAGVPPNPSTDPRALTDRQFVAMVRGLDRDDPRFVRRCSAPSSGSLARTDIMILMGVLATLVLGVVPLAVGVHLAAGVLLAAGVVGCVAAPVLAPWLTRRVMIRRRPLWL